MTDTERRCEDCAYARPFSEYSNRCTAWECEYIPRKEAIEAWKKLKAEEATDDAETKWLKKEGEFM